MTFKITIPDDSPFTINNIPFGVISTISNSLPRCATAIGDYALDLGMFWENRPFNLEGNVWNLSEIFRQPHLNDFSRLPHDVRSAVRGYLMDAIENGDVAEDSLVPLREAQMHLPMKIGGYSDFFCSLEHCQNCSQMTGPMAQNFFHAPSVYNGRVSSVVPSSTPIRRPMGVMYDTGRGSGNPIYGASKKMDFELEMGYFVSAPIKYGQKLNIADAAQHIFGFVLLNDWSSRDIQAFEMKPLGPFHSKGFGTSISPWIVTLDALKPFACAPSHDHSAETFDHLKWKDGATATFNIQLTTFLQRNKKKYPLVQSNIRFLYWSPYQQITHHASAGCGLETGDLLGTGTISGRNQGELGCLFEATLDGSRPIILADDDVLGYLEDHDEVILEAWCGTGHIKIGFGECRGVLLPAEL